MVLPLVVVLKPLYVVINNRQMLLPVLADIIAKLTDVVVNCRLML